MKNKAPDGRKIYYGRTVILFVILDLMAATVLYTSHIIYGVAADNIHETGENRISAAAAQIENYLNRAKNVQWVMADTVDSMARDGETSGDILRYITEETEKHAHQFGEGYTGIYGYVMGEYLDGLSWTPPAGYDPTARPWYSAAIEAKGELAIVRPYTDAQTNMPVISFSAMLSNGRDVLALDMTVKRILALLEQLYIHGKGYAFIVDEDGRVVAHRDMTQIGLSLSGTDEGRALAARLAETRNGNFEMTLDGRESTVFAHELMGRWRLAAVAANDDLFAEIRRRLWANAFAHVVVFAMIAKFYHRGYKNEQEYFRRMEAMRIEEQRQAFEAKALKLEKEAAAQKNQAKSDFLAEMSHDIRTPINVVLGMNEIILRESGDASIHAYARNVESAGRSLLSIIDDILDFNKIEAGKMEITKAPYRLASLLNDVSNMVQFQARSKGLAFDVEVDETLPDELYGDEARVRQVISNVLNNAVKYTREGGVTLSVRGTREGDTLRLSVAVSDTGAGIRKEDMKRLFEKFERADLEQNKAVEGTGLGLAIVQNLLRLMDGWIHVESEYGKGSVFTVTIPQGIVSDEPVGDFRKKFAQNSQNATAYRETFRAPEARVLAVDDTEMNLTVICGLLRETGLRIDTASSGADALDLTKDTAYDLILMDQRMPGMDGTETLRRIREQEGGNNKETPVICLTADAVQSAKERYLAQGFTDYLSKPVEGAALEASLMKYLPPGKVVRVRQKAGEGKPPQAGRRGGENMNNVGAARGPSAPSEERLSPEEALEEIRSATPGLLASYRALAESLGRYFEAKDGAQAAGAEERPEMDAEELREVYDGILEFAEMYDFKSIARLLKRVEGCAIPEAERERFALVKECAQNSDWAGLHEALKG